MADLVESRDMAAATSDSPGGASAAELHEPEFAPICSRLGSLEHDSKACTSGWAPQPHLSGAAWGERGEGEEPESDSGDAACRDSGEARAAVFRMWQQEKVQEQKEEEKVDGHDDNKDSFMAGRVMAGRDLPAISTLHDDRCDEGTYGRDSGHAVEEDETISFVCQSCGTVNVVAQGRDDLDVIASLSSHTSVESGAPRHSTRTGSKQAEDWGGEGAEEGGFRCEICGEEQQHEITTCAMDDSHTTAESSSSKLSTALTADCGIKIAAPAIQLKDPFLHGRKTRRTSAVMHAILHKFSRFVDIFKRETK